MFQKIINKLKEGFNKFVEWNAEGSQFEKKPIANAVDSYSPTQAPTIAPTATPSPVQQQYEGIPPVKAQAKMLLDSPIATDSAKAYLDKIFTDYVPKTPDVPEGWKSPLLGSTQAMAESIYENKMHPALAALMAIAETQAMRPLASGTSKLNPYNVMNPGTQNLFDYNPYGLDYAVSRWPENIAKNWRNDNITKWRENPTLEDFIFAYNPIDNPQQELDTILQLIESLGLGGTQSAF